MFKDLIAGITLGVVLIPIAMAFGELAGVGAVAGLKASILPLIAYSLFSSSKLIIIGPEASTAALVGATIAPLALGDPDKAVVFASILALLTGLFLLVAKFARLGFIANYIPKQVLIGFLTALGIMIIIEQLSQILGLSISADTPFAKLQELFAHINEIHLPTLLVALGSLVIISLFSKFIPWLPGQIVVMILGVALVEFFHIDRLGIQTLGKLPEANLHFSFPKISWSEFTILIPGALSIAIIAFTDSILTARVFAEKNKSELDPNQESLALSLGNLASALTQTMPVSVSASRTSIAESLGAKTRLVGIVAPLIILLFIYFRGLEQIQYLPKAILGSILIIAGWNLIELTAFLKFYKFHKRGFAVALLTLFAVLSVGVLEGVFIAVVFAFTLVVYYLAKDQTSIINTEPGILVIHVGSSIFFANSHTIHTVIRKLIKPESKYVLIDATSIFAIDYAGAEMLAELQTELAEQNITLGMIHVKDSIKDSLNRMENKSNLLIINNLNEIKQINLDDNLTN